MMRLPTQLFDAMAALSLVAALLVVRQFDRSPNLSPPIPPIPQPGNELVVQVHLGEAPKATKTERKALRLGVTSGPKNYDDMGRLLKTLGPGYRYDVIDLDQLRKAGELSRFDIVFLACSVLPGSWLGDQVGVSARPDVTIKTFKPEAAAEVKETLRSFVNQGGTLYASDFHLSLLRHSFPEVCDRIHPEGIKQDIVAAVLDPGLREQVGKSLPLRFDQDDWKSASFRGPGMQVLLEGDFRAVDGSAVHAPLLSKMPFGKGAIIFTSFHNEAVNSDAETKLLKYLVFSAATSQVEREMSAKMIEGGFAPKQSTLITASPGVASVTQSYLSKRIGTMRFQLGFNPEGNARLRLDVRSPDGKTASAEHTSMFTIEVPNAPAGEWQYTITAVSVPYPNFPFRVTVGEEK
jgi:hypothetical protein